MKRLILLVTLLAAAPASSALAQDRPDGQVRAQLLPAQPVGRPAEPGPHAHPLRTLDPEALAAGRGAARHSAFSSPGAGSLLTASAPQSLAVSAALNQPGVAASDNSLANQGTPPDPTGAIGPDHYVEFVNSKVAVYSRADLTLAGSMADLDSFVGQPGDAVFDPQIQWDQQSGRWFYLADDVASSSSNYLAFGFSKTSDPSDLSATGWCRYRLSTGVSLDDYPKLGHDDSHLIFGTNVYSDNGSTGTFLTSRIWSLPKPAAGTITSCPATPTASFFGNPSNSAQTLRTADGDVAFTPVPTDTADSASVGYVVAADYPSTGSGSQIMAWHVGGTSSSPTLTSDGNMNVTSYGFPAEVPQPGTTFTLDPSDTRLTQAVAHADPAAGGAEAVWTQHTVDGPGGRSVVRWYELLPATTTVRQEGTIEDASQFVFNGAVSPAMNGTTAVIQYNTGGPADLTEIRAQSRAGGDTLGSMSNEITLGTSSAGDQDFSCGPGPCRWGDYAGATPDPASTTDVWGTNQLIGASTGPGDTDAHWTTRNFALTQGPDLTPPNTTIISGPVGPTNDTTPTFTFSSTESGTFECKVDGGAWASCATPYTTAPLSDGPHTFFVRATDAASNTDPTPASLLFTVDTTPPDTTITGGPSGSTTDFSPTFSFSSSEASRFQCRVDGLAWEVCVSPYATGPLPDGPHTFSVRAIDLASNTDPTPAISSFTVAAVSGPPPPSGGGAGSSAPPGGASARLTSKVLKVAGGRLLVGLSCPRSAGQAGCRGSLVVQGAKPGASPTRRVTVAGGRFQLVAARTATLRLRLSAAGRKSLRRRSSLRAGFVETWIDSAGTKHRLVAGVTVRASSRR